MHVQQTTLEISTSGGDFVDITARVAKLVQESGIQTGLCTLFVKHTSASLTIQENADPTVRADLKALFAELVPEWRGWAHDLEGPDDMPAHARTVLTRTSENIPIGEGRLHLGTWQAIYLWEHRERPHQRTVVVHIQGKRG
jgi:secondary thiamine-phosphate synthase enzyme